jgi:Na+/phosphate symporter
MPNDSDPERLQAPEVRDLKSGGLNEGFPIMVGKLIETGLLLSTCISTGDQNQISRCEALARDVYAHEKTLTRNLLASKPEDLPKTLIHLPFLLQRICQNLDDILNCCRLKTKDGILLTEKAEAHLQQLLAILVDMMNNLRDAFTVPDVVLVESIISEGNGLNRMLRDLRSAHWSHPRVRSSAFQGAAVYLDILDAIKSANEDVGNICQTLLELERLAAVSTKVPERVDAGKCD